MFSVLSLQMDYFRFARDPDTIPRGAAAKEITLQLVATFRDLGNQREYIQT